MNKNSPTSWTLIFTLLLLTSFSLQPRAFAMDPINQLFRSVRAEGMGDVRYTTGLYEENFFANPARVTSNPEDRFQLPQISLEAGSDSLSTLSTLTGGGSELGKFGSAEGKPLSARFQLVLPAYYNNTFISDKWAMAIGFELAAQTQWELSQVGSFDPNTRINMGPAITLARRFLEEDRLSVGTTFHSEFVSDVNQIISITDYFAGTKLSGTSLGGNGLGVDFDLGATYDGPWSVLGFQFQFGLAINNILGGAYTNLGRPVTTWPGNPTSSNRFLNFGASARREEVGGLDYVIVALEFTDIGNNPNGSAFRTIHFGTEAQWKVFKMRLGINQGYPTAGFGIDLHALEINFATYGEEMGLNVGDLEDRRYALELGFQI